MDMSTARPVDRYFASYSGDHRNETNQAIHVVAGPAILSLTKSMEAMQ